MVSQYEVHLINFDPTVGHEIEKTRPCLIISPDEMNSNLSTLLLFIKLFAIVFLQQHT